MNRGLTMARLARFILVAAAVTLLPLGCQPAEKPAGPREKITIAYSTATNAVLMYIALAQGYLAEEGLDVTAQPYPFGKLALEAVVEKRADLATVASTPIMFAVMAGKEITTLAAVQTASRNEGIVARRDRGIVKTTDLKGKTIGVTIGTTADFFLDSFLLFHDIDRDDVTIIDMKPAEMASALKSGAVDAISAFNPALSQAAQELGSNAIIFYGEEFYTEIFCLAADPDYVHKHPEAIKKVLRALIKAETYVQEHPGEAQKLTAEFTHTDIAIVAAIWNVFTFRVTLNQSLLIDFEDQSRWAMRNKLTKRNDMPNYLDHIYVDGLEAVKPQAVSLIRPGKNL